MEYIIFALYNDMKYDDKISVLTTEKAYEKRLTIVLKHLKKNYPEYSTSDSRVTVEMIKLISTLPFEDFNKEINEEVPFPFLYDEQALEVLEKLPKHFVNNPLNLKTINAISDLSNEVICRDLTNFFAETECDGYGKDDSRSLSNRANAMSSFKRHDDALRDFTKACEIDPEDITPFLGRAKLFVELGMTDNAREDARYILSKINDSKVESLEDGNEIASVLYACGEKHLALLATLRFLEAFNEVIPYRVQNQFGNYLTMDLEGTEILYMNYDELVQQVSECIDRIKEIEQNENNPSIITSIESCKIAILTLRSRGGF